MIEVTNEAYSKLVERASREKTDAFRIGLTGGGCAGYEYIFDYCKEPKDNDFVIDYGEIKFNIDPMSGPYVQGMTIDWVVDGVNEQFKFINPQEQASCGCGVSVGF